jgi:hypothetical protein
LLDEPHLTSNQRAVVSIQLHRVRDNGAGRESIYETPVASVLEFAAAFASLGDKCPNAEIFLNGRWYPVVLNLTLLKDEAYLVERAILRACLSICDSSYSLSYRVDAQLFLDAAGQPQGRTVIDVLNQVGFRRLQTSPRDYNLKLLRAERGAREQGQVVVVSGPVLVRSPDPWYPRWSWLETRTLGSCESPRKAIVEPELEVPEQERCYQALCEKGPGVPSRLPFVRVSSTKAQRQSSICRQRCPRSWRASLRRAWNGSLAT